MYSTEQESAAHVTYLLKSSSNSYPHTRREGVQSCPEKVLVRNSVLLKPVQERSRSVLHFRFLYNDNTLEVLVDPTRFVVATNGNVCIELGLFGWVRIVNPPEVLVEEVVEALMNVVSLRHQHCLPFFCSMPDGSYGVHLNTQAS